MQRGNKNGGLNNEEEFVTLFNKSSIKTVWTSSILSKKCELSESYLHFKRQKTPTASLVDQSKTDVLLTFNPNPEIRHKISLKRGQGRPTSGNVSETYALMLSVFQDNHSTNIELSNLLDKIFSHLPSGIITSKWNVTQLKKDITNPDPEFNRARDEIRQWKEQYDICNTLWKEMKEKHGEYVRDVFEECLSGKLKFANNEGTASFVIDIDIVNNGFTLFNIIPLTHSNKKLSQYIDTLVKNTNSPFATKSSRQNSNSPYKIWTRFL